MTRLEASRSVPAASRADAPRGVAAPGAAFQAVLDAMLPVPGPSSSPTLTTGLPQSPDTGDASAERGLPISSVPAIAAAPFDSMPADVPVPAIVQTPGDHLCAPARLSVDATPDAPPAVRHVEDGTRTTLLPWGLQAHAGLSYVETASGGFAAPSPLSCSVAPRDPREVAPEATSTRAATPASRLSGQALSAELQCTATHPVPGRSTRIVARDAPSAAHDAAWPGASGESFAARHLQWQADADGVTAFARDYRIADDAIPALVHSIRSAAGESPLSLRRIVLNGREVWRAALSTRPKGT